jgi:hypothetical protein
MASRGTHREVMANRTDVIIKNRKEKTCILIDVAIQADRNVMQKETENKKIKTLSTETQRMWNTKCTIIPLATGATRIALKTHLRATPGDRSISSLQKSSNTLEHDTKYVKYCTV